MILIRQARTEPRPLIINFTTTLPFYRKYRADEFLHNLAIAVVWTHRSMCCEGGRCARATWASAAGTQEQFFLKAGGRSSEYLKTETPWDALAHSPAIFA